MSEQPEEKSVPLTVPAEENTARLVHESLRLSAPLSDNAARAAMGTRSRRSFLVGAGAVLAGGLGLRWLISPRRQHVLERVLQLNEEISRKTFRAGALAPEFPRRLATVPRVNGTEGLSEGFDPGQWRLQVTGLGSSHTPGFAENLSYDGDVDRVIEMKFPAVPIPGLLLTLDAIKALPRVEMTTELKCIEGWSNVVSWAGARTSDLVAKFGPLADDGNSVLPPYVSLVTPDRGYYVGWDTPAFLHPQTLLCYEMNGEALTLPHGGPLRLVSTSKYGIKQIKRIGRISFTQVRPADFWAEQGYDWYSGL